jgi:O-antigen/teichoic acid export membrane protein
MRLARTTLVHFGSRVAISVTGFVATLYTARVLGADILGRYVIIVGFLYWLNVPNHAVGKALTKRLSEGERRGELLAAGGLVAGVIVAVVCLVLVATGNVLDRRVTPGLSTFLIPMVVGSALFVPLKATLKGDKRVGTAGLVSAVDRTLRTALQIGLIVLGYNLGGLVVGHVGGLVLSGVVGLYLLGPSPSVPSAEDVRSLLSFARYSWLGAIKTRAFGWMDTIVLAFFVQASLIGIYEVAWNLASLLAMISVSVSQTLFPELSELDTEDRYDRIHHYLDEGMVFIGIFAIPGFFGALIVGPEVLKIYSPEFRQGFVVLLMLIVAKLVAAFNSQFLSAINAVDRPDVAFRVNSAFIVANLVLNVALVYRFGWYGAAVATALSAALSLGLSYYALSGLIGRPSVPYAEFLRQGVAAIAMAAVLAVVSRAVPSNNYTTVLLVLFGATVYTALLVAISGRVRSKSVGLVDSVLA